MVYRAGTWTFRGFGRLSGLRRLRRCRRGLRVWVCRVPVVEHERTPVPFPGAGVLCVRGSSGCPCLGSGGRVQRHTSCLREDSREPLTAVGTRPGHDHTIDSASGGCPEAPARNVLSSGAGQGVHGPVLLGGGAGAWEMDEPRGSGCACTRGVWGRGEGAPGGV